MIASTAGIVNAHYQRREGVPNFVHISVILTDHMNVSRLLNDLPHLLD
jgi:hypothetical protein